MESRLYKSERERERSCLRRRVIWHCSRLSLSAWLSWAEGVETVDFLDGVPVVEKERI